jgi:hypothetical protein
MIRYRASGDDRFFYRLYTSSDSDENETTHHELPHILFQFIFLLKMKIIIFWDKYYEKEKRKSRDF